MSNAFLAELDADIHIALADPGMADFGTYRATAAGEPFAGSVACMVDRGSQLYGSQQQAGTGEIFITVFRQPGLSVVANGVIDIDGERFRLSRLEDSDESMQRWAAVLLGPTPVAP